jgi:hypothetical protein
VLGRRRLQIRAERPLDAILGQAVPKDGTGVIEDDDVGLAVGGSQPTANHLSV